MIDESLHGLTYKYIDRLDTLRLVQKDMCYLEMTMRVNEREIKEMLFLFNTLKQYIEQEVKHNEKIM